MIIRHLQAATLRAMSQFPAVAVLGPRQVGKTTLAHAIAASGEGFVYLDLENPRDEFRLRDSFSYLSGLNDKCVILDEIQLLPRLFSELRPLIDERRTAGRFILLGSASPKLVQGVSESLAGRISYLELAAINLLELPEKQSLQDHWFYGGFPEPVLLEQANQKIAWLDAFIISYVERDMGRMFGVELSSVTLRHLWTMLAHSNGNLWNAETLSRSLGVTGITVSRYLSFTEGAYLVRRLLPWSVNAKKRLVKSPKIYIRDSGICHRLLNISDYDALLGHPAVGASWEGYVIEQVYQKKGSGIEVWFYRTQAGAECDLVLTRSLEVIACLEIKLSNTPVVSKGFFSACDDLKPLKRFVVTPQNDLFTMANGTFVCGLRVFLMSQLVDL